MTRTIIRPGLSPEQSANSFEDVELEGMSCGNSPKANAYRELLAFRQGAEQATAMAELLRDLRKGVELHLHNAIVTNHEFGAECQQAFLDRIDAALAGNVPAPVREVPQSVVGHVQHSKQVITDAVRNVIKAATAPKPECQCHTCRPVTMTDMRMVVCSECGNKRCPKASDHRNACTGSNEPVQPGSVYPAAPKPEGDSV